MDSTISANAAKAITYDNIAVSGYTPIGIVGFFANAYGDAFGLTYSNISGNSLVTVWHNFSATSRTDTLRVRILYMRSSV